jgi:hypothetical protein
LVVPGESFSFFSAPNLFFNAIEPVLRLRYCAT